MKRWISSIVTLAFVAGCSGMGSGNRFLPGAQGVAPGEIGSSATRSTHDVNVYVTMRIPRRHRHEHAAMHPSTISSQTQSVSIGVNTGAARVFNATPSSPNCAVVAGATRCTFAVSAPPGTDAFTVKTYSATGGAGMVLDYGKATVAIVAGKANAASVVLGPVVSVTADSGPGSLRAAIGAANPGDTIMFLLPATAKITLSKPLTPLTSLTIAGPGFKTSIPRSSKRDGLHPATTYSGITLSGGGATQIFVVNAGITLRVSGLVLTQGKASSSNQPGGAIYNAGSLALASDAFVSNTSIVNSPYVARKPHTNAAARNPRRHKPAHLHPHVCPPGSDAFGGALYNHSIVTITGSTFDSNRVGTNWSCYYGYGGAIYNDSYGTLTSSGNLYANNGAYYGGAVYNNASYGQVSFTTDKFENNFGCTAANGCPTAGCTSTGGCSTYDYGYGGAIYDAEGPGISVISSTFTGNKIGDGPDGYGEGGALYLDTGSPIVTGSTFTGNFAGGGTANCASGYGGAITYYSSQLTVNNDTFTSNEAGGDDYGEGGAIYGDEPLAGTNDKFTGNLAFGSSSPCSSSSYAYGGAVYEYSSSYSVTFTNSTFSGNKASGEYYAYGGAVYPDGPATFMNDTFTGNLANGTGVNGSYSYAYGGAIYGGSQLKISASTFTSNAAVAQGLYGYYAYAGAVYSDSTFGSTGNTYTSNSVSAGQYEDAYVYGGAIYASSGMASSHDTFKSNVAKAPYEAYGGGVYLDSDSNLANDTFAGNSVSVSSYESQGGGLYNDSTTQIFNSTFTGNTAVGSGEYGGQGGGIYDDGGMTLSGSTVSGNTATQFGGGMYTDTTDTIANTTVSGNVVTAAPYEGGGGGIYNDGPSTITNSTISGNTAKATGLYSGGGGIYNEDNLTLTGSTIAGNSVTGTIGSAGGGGIYSISAANVLNDTIAGNTSTVDGGGFETHYSSHNNYLTNATLYGNKATGNGGNVANNFLLEIWNTIVAHGTAGSGADIYNAGSLPSGDYNIIQTAVVGNALSGITTHNQKVDPLLLALANNGGPTATMADHVGSPGAHTVPYSSSTCGSASVTGTNADQRGFGRGTGSKCDVGAFELEGVAGAIKLRPQPNLFKPDHRAHPNHNQHRHHRNSHNGGTTK